jgi:3-oxoacyl-[acyl-carrier protein] reductase
VDLGIAGKVAVVTGAGRGIGRAVARALAREGVRVALISRTLGDLETVAGLIAGEGGEASPFLCDVTSRPQVAEMALAVASRLGPVQILINNAAAPAEVARIEVMSDVAYDATIRENLEMVHAVTKAFLPRMREEGWGRIINIGSLVADIGGHGQVAYATAKAALVGFTRTVAVEYGRHGITANLVVPGTVLTEAQASALPEKARELVRMRSALKRLGDPDDVAAAVVFLASAQAGYITGASIPVTGGYELNYG